MFNSPLPDFQQLALDALTKQQDAYLALVREWKNNVAAASNVSTETPTSPSFSFTPGDMPSGAEFAKQQQVFYARIVEQQQRFITSLNEILGAGK